MTEEIRCDWCNESGHEDCSERMTFDELYEKIMCGDDTVRKLLVFACESDQGNALEMGCSSSWEPLERGYALLWERLQKQEVQHT